MSRQINILYRKLILKYAQSTVRSPSMPGMNQKSLNLEDLVQQTQNFEQNHYEQEPPTQRPGNDIIDDMELGEGELPYEERDESTLTPYQQQLVYVLDKMFMNHLVPQVYVDTTYRRIVDADLAGQKMLAEEFQVHMSELEESARYYQVTIDEIKKYLSRL